MCGLGTVGSQVYLALRDSGRLALIKQRTACDMQLYSVASRSKKDFDLSKLSYHTDLLKAVSDPKIDVVMEAIGGTDTALDIARLALKNGKHLITANKDLLANYGDELFALASQQQVQLLWEASVGGAIPVVRALRDGLCGDNIQHIDGIMNGTSNYMLSAMTRGEDFDQALQEAQELGYAEADPRADIDGIDAAHKLLLLTGLAWGVTLKGIKKISTQSIKAVEPIDIQCAKEFSYCIKPIAQASLNEHGQAILSVAPCLVAIAHPLSQLDGVNNGISINGDISGKTSYIGAGAGGSATAAAMLSDLCAIGLNNHAITPQPRTTITTDDILLRSHYLRFIVKNQTGVLSTITSLFSHHNINLRQAWQPVADSNSTTTVALITEACDYKQLQKLIVATQTIKTVLAPALRLDVIMA